MGLWITSVSWTPYSI